MTGIAIPRPDRDGNIPARAVVEFCTQVMQQLEQLQRQLMTPSGASVQDAINGLLKQPDGVVVKVAGNLFTAPIGDTSGLKLTVKQSPSSTVTNAALTVPLLAGVADGADGLLAKSGAGALQPRTLVAGTGFVFTIDNANGAGGNPTFHT